MKELIERLRNYDAITKMYPQVSGVNKDTKTVYAEAADAIEKLQAMNDELEYALAGVMHSVDKWLEADDFDKDEVQRAAIMREKTLQIVEKLQAELKHTKSERDAAVADAKELAKTLIYEECVFSVCGYCKKGDTCNDECDFEWRGAQDDE